MSADLEEQLEAYGDWLRQTLGSDLTPFGTNNRGAGRDVGVDSEPDRHAGFRHNWLRVAAAFLVLAGIGGLVLAQRDTDPAPATAAVQYTSPTDPAAHLFVLPTDREGLELSSGEVYTARPDEVDAAPPESAEVLTGTEVDGGFSNLVLIITTNVLPDTFGIDGSTTVETPTGPALVASDQLPYQRLAQERDGVWVLMIGADGNQDLIDLLPHVSIDPTGSLTLLDNQRVIIDELSRDPAAEDYSTSYDITDPSSGISFSVETATSPSALLLGAYTPHTVTPTTVNGTTGWIMTRGSDSPEGVSTAIVWRATPNRIIAISTNGGLEEVQAMAERLQQVSNEDWFAALPGAFSQN